MNANKQPLPPPPPASLQPLPPPPNYYEKVGDPAQIQGQVIYVQAPPGPNDQKIDDYMVFSILNLIFCNLILGIIAVIYSSKTKTANQQGQQTDAKNFSKIAKRINIISLVLGIVSALATVLLAVFWLVPFLQELTKEVQKGLIKN